MDTYNLDDKRVSVIGYSSGTNRAYNLVDGVITVETNKENGKREVVDKNHYITLAPKKSGVNSENNGIEMKISEFEINNAQEIKYWYSSCFRKGVFCFIWLH